MDMPQCKYRRLLLLLLAYVETVTHHMYFLAGLSISLIQPHIDTHGGNSRISASVAPLAGFILLNMRESEGGREGGKEIEREGKR